MNTNSNNKEEIKSAYRQLLKEYQWKMAKAQRALDLYETKFQNIRQKLAIALQSQEENTQIFEILSPINPLKKKVEDELYRGRIRIQKLEARLEKYSEVKKVKLWLKVQMMQISVEFYESQLLELNTSLKRVYPKPQEELSKARILDSSLSFEHERESFSRAG